MVVEGDGEGGGCCPKIIRNEVRQRTGICIIPTLDANLECFVVVIGTPVHQHLLDVVSGRLGTPESGGRCNEQ